MRRLYGQHSGSYTVSELCGLFGKSKQAYYKHDGNAELRRLALEEFAVQYIREVKAKDPGIGGMKVWAMYCRTFGERDRIGRDRFCDIFDRYGFKIRRRRRVRTTDSRHNNPTYPNIVKEVIPTRFGEIVVGDITYVAGGGLDGERRFCYVSLLMDSYSKMILGYSVGMTLEIKYPMEALKDAVRVLRSYGVNLSATIHHSDRGVQYTCADYVTELLQNNMMISMTESGNPKDNAEAETYCREALSWGNWWLSRGKFLTLQLNPAMRGASAAPLRVLGGSFTYGKAFTYALFLGYSKLPPLNLQPRMKQL